jgi:hypothetical protein
MPLAHVYPDAYLRSLVTEAREAQAIAEVSDVGTLPPSWVPRLVVLRAYINTCLESQKAPDDLFAAKLSAYRKEWDGALTQARIAQSAIDAEAGGGPGGAGAGFGFVALERS